MKKKFGFFAIGIIVTITPVLVHLLLTFGKAITENDWIGFFGSYFGAIIGGIIAFAIARYQIKKNFNDQEKKERKLSRLYPNIEHLNYYFDLKKIKEFQKNNSSKSMKVIETEGYSKKLKEYSIAIKEYKKIKEKKEKLDGVLSEPDQNLYIVKRLNKEILEETRITYITLEFLGRESIVRNVQFEIEILDKEYSDKRKLVTSTLGIVDVNTIFYFPLILDGWKKPQINKINLNFETLQEETMILIQDYQLKNEKLIVRFEKEENIIFSNELKNIEWYLG